MKQTLILLLLLTYSADAAEAFLEWTPNPERDLASYRIYRSSSGTGSTTPRALVKQVPSTTTNTVVPDLVAGVTYTFDAVAVGSTGIEGKPSEEVVYTPPLADISPPLIISSPVNQIAVWSLPATFSVVATGTQPLFYQWFKDGSAVPGATSPGYTISSVSDTDAGNYAVRITNAAGAIMSTTAMLTVQHLPPGQVRNFIRKNGPVGLVVGSPTQ